MKKEFIDSPDFRLKQEASQDFLEQVRNLTKWEKFNLKKANSFNSLLYCYEENGVEYAHLGVDDEVRQKGNDLARWSQQTKYSYLGRFTGELLREDIERRV
jgi:hypothetical protein